MSGINNSNRDGPEGEWLVITYGTGDRSRFGEPGLGMVLVTTPGA